MKKRFFTIVLCLVLCLAVLPMAAFADETEEEVECFHESIYYEATEEGHVAHCADCGAVFSMESHNFMGVSDSDRHWIRCVDCEYCTHFGEHGNCTEQDVDYCLYCNALREECTTWLTEHKDADGNGSCDLCGTAVVPETPHEDGWAQNADGKWKYFENGVAVTGWKKVSGKWYYLGSDGIMQTGWQQVGKTWYYLDSDGVMCCYWQTVGGKNYYLGADGAMQTGWQQIGGKWYYLGSDGAMRTGWQQVGKKWYYLGSDGIMQTKWQQIGGKWYYLGSDGAMCTKWQQIGGKWYYLGSDGAMCTKWQQVGKKWYYLGSDGAMQTGWQEIGGVWYYLGSDGAMQTGWQQIGKKWYYLGSDGAMRTDWQKIGGEWYYLGADGAMRTDWQKIGKKWYYLGSDGKMWTGWLYEDTDGDGYKDPAYYFDPNGAMVTGWYKTSNSWIDPAGFYHEATWCYMKPDGRGYNGFLVENGHTYYISGGRMQTGWVWIDEDNDGLENCYCFGTDGAMVTGWYEVSESYFTDWYYFDEDGKGHNGWLKDNGYTYYFWDGSMCTGWAGTDDGYHKFSDDGHLIDLSLTSSQKNEAKKIKYLDHYMQTHSDLYSDYYEFNVSFVDEDYSYLTGIPCFISVKIYNDNGEYLTSNSVEFSASSDIWLSIRISKNFIRAGNIDSGYAQITVTIPGYVTLETNETIYGGLPLKPAEIVLQNSLPSQLTECNVTSFSCEIGRYSTAFYFTGTRTTDSMVTTHCHIPWKLYDSDGYVVDSGSCLSPSVLYGESFIDAKDYSYAELKAGRTYYLTLY